MKISKILFLISIVFVGCTSKIVFEPEQPIVKVFNTDLLISEISTAINTDPNASGTRSHYVELYNGTANAIDLSNYAVGYFACTDTFTLTNFSFTPTTTITLNRTLDTAKCYIIASPQVDVTKINRDTTWGTTSTLSANASVPLQLSGNSAIALLKKDASGTITIGGNLYRIIDVFGSPLVRRFNFIGTPSARNNIMWQVGDERADTRNRTFFRKSTVTSPTTDWEISRGTNNANSQWIFTSDRAWDYTNVKLPTR